MADIQLAIKFVQDHGNTVEQARLHVLLQDRALVREAVDALKMMQREDGSWAPFWAPDASSIDATCYSLAQCEQLGLRSEEFIDQAISFLIGRQNTDGSFEEDAALAPVAPPWAMPGDASAKLYITANAGCWISHFRSSDPCLAMIGEFLASNLNKGYLPGFLHANWLAAGLLYSLGKHKDAQSILAYLHSELAMLEASNLAWLINALCIMDVTPDHPLISDAINKLQALQHEDGRWVSEDGEWQDVHTTLESIRAILQFAASV